MEESIHVFGRVEVRPFQRCVRVDGQVVPLGSRAFDVLVALIERRDRLVSKHELMDLVWPGLAVEENNLAVHISALRKALGTQLIATVPRRGYRFTLPVETRTPLRPGADKTVAPAPSTARSLPSGGLSALPTRLIGREHDAQALQELLETCGLVSVVGGVGVGKTALALETAHRVADGYRDGLAWVNLCDVHDPADLPRAVAQAARLPVPVGTCALQALAEFLHPQKLLLVLDNAEHLREGVHALARLLQPARTHAGVRMLVTSLVPLKAEGERVFRLGPLSVPEPESTVREALSHGAVALYVDQAQAAERSFRLTDDNVALVVELCRRLDGMTLAIKLAAARSPLFGLQGLVSGLDDRLRLLSMGLRGVPERHQTLVAALAWSHSLLDERAQRVFRRLAVFAGGFTLEMVVAVGGTEGEDRWHVIEAFGELVERSLVESDGTSHPRYHLLETVRAYARLKLDEAAEQEQVQARHALHLADWMDDAYETYWSSADQPWLDTHAAELDNVRVALDWSLPRQPALALRLASAASLVFLMIGQAPEARRRLEALEAAAAEPGPYVSRYWLERSRLLYRISCEHGRDFALRAARLYEAAADRRGRFLALRCAVGHGALSEQESLSLLSEMAQLEAPDWGPRLRTQRLMAEIGVLMALGRLDEARAACCSLLSMAHAARLGSVASVALVELAACHLALGEPGEALVHATAYVNVYRPRSGNMVLHALATAAQALLTMGRLAPAREAIAELITLSRIRNWEWFGLFTDVFALLALAEDRLEDAARLVGHADAAHRRAGLHTARAKAAREAVCASLGGRIDGATIARLMSDGGRMDEETICAVATGADPPERGPGAVAAWLPATPMSMRVSQ